MDRVRVEGDVEVDVCDEHGVWLDRGELERIVTHHERVSMQAAKGRKTKAQGSSTLTRAGQRAVTGAASTVATTLARSLVRKLLG